MNIEENREYVKNNLEPVPEKGKTYYPYGKYRGTYHGNSYWKRQDGTPLNAQDLEALKSQSSARWSKVKGSSGDMEAMISFSHDSTD